jgi:hypothetical protein
MPTLDRYPSESITAQINKLVCNNPIFPQAAKEWQICGLNYPATGKIATGAETVKPILFILVKILTQLRLYQRLSS